MGGGGLSFLNKKTWHPARLDRQVRLPVLKDPLSHRFMMPGTTMSVRSISSRCSDVHLVMQDDRRKDHAMSP